jgi:hypothetical protein
MVCAARILVALTLLVSGTEGAIPAWMVAGVVSSLQRRYFSGCVFLLQTADKADLSKHFTLSVVIRRYTFPMSSALLRKNISERSFPESMDW